MNRLIGFLAASSIAAVVAGCGDDASSVECGANTSEVDGVCVADVNETTCGTGTVASGTECVPDGSVICETGTTFDMDSGTCVADITGCGTGTIVVDGECKDPADVTTDVSEAAEPNDLSEGTPGTFDLPAVGDAITIGGCIEPTEDGDTAIADFDAYIFTGAGPALLDITVDGFGGAAGAFQLQTGDQELFDAGFQRFGVNLANDMSQRTVFLPKAADFAITFGDSRTIITGLPAGGPGACYVATIRNVAIPAATAATPGTAVDGTFTGDTQFIGLTPAADGAIAISQTSAENENALVDSVLMVNDVYRSSNPGLGDRNFGDDAGNTVGGLNTADDVVYVIDPVINLSLLPVDFSHLITDIPVVAMATDGASVSVPSPNNSGSVISFNVASTDDVIFLDLDAAGFSNDVDWFILNSNLEQVATIATFSGGQETGHYRFEDTGIHYIEIQDFSGSTVDPFNFVSTQIDHTPTALTVGTPVTAQVFDVDNAGFYTITPGVLEWWNITGTPTAFDDNMLLSVFDDADSGKLFLDAPTVAEFVLVGGEDNLQLLEDADPVLLMISDDSATPNAAATFDFSIADNVFTDLGTVALAAPVNSVVTGASADEYYLASANNGETINLTVTGNNGLDPILVLITSDGETILDDNTGADTAEQNFTFAANGVIAFAIRDVGGVGGDYTLDLSILVTQNLTSAPALAIPDNDPVGVQDTITAAACTIGAINIDLDVSHTFIGDLLVTVTSPTGTVVTLHNRAGGGNSNIVGNYNQTLTSDDDLTVLNGEEALGDWIISVDDNFGLDTGDLNSWGLNMVCL